MPNKLNFGLYCYGDAYLKSEIDENRAYIIENNDKFGVEYFDNAKDYYISLGHYDTIYDALDAANAHYAAQRAQEDKFIMPERAELEIFEDNQPGRPCNSGVFGKSDVNPSSTIEKSYQKEFRGK